MQSKLHVAVIGAGAFGGWTALHLLRRGARVTLLDAWGPGNSRASSGGETRVIRGTYGANQPYTKMVVRALQLWKEHEKLWHCQFFHPIGVLWLAGADDQFERGSLPMLREAGISYAELSAQEIGERWPQISLEGSSLGNLRTGKWLPQSASCVPGGAGRISSRRRRIQAGRRGGAGPRGRQTAKPPTVRRFQNSGRSIRLCLRALAGQALSQGDRRFYSSHQAGHIFLWHAQSEMIAFPRGICRYGAIIGIGSCTEFQAMKDAVLRLPMTLVERTSIPPPESEWWMPKG